MNALVGYTGFVGSNIYAVGKIDAAYNSKNIADAYGTAPELLIYAGLRAEKYLANSTPEKDEELIYEAEKNISRIKPKKLVLISTIDVFNNPVSVNEDSQIDIKGLHPYGYNRYMLEKWVRENYPDSLIIRLPGLFGRNIKKNFIYDFINVIPSMLKDEKFAELSFREPILKNYYRQQDNGFYKLSVNNADKNMLKAVFRRLKFSALNFTDSRSIYQFYDLNRLWDDIQTALNAGITLLHTATEPVSAAELYKYLTGEEFINELNGVPAAYDYRTIHEELFHGKNGYICSKDIVMSSIGTLVRNIHGDV